MQYVAFLLGINLGTRSVKMAELKALMEREGYARVRTIIASGNEVSQDCFWKKRPPCATGTPSKG